MFKFWSDSHYQIPCLCNMNIYNLSTNFVSIVYCLTHTKGISAKKTHTNKRDRRLRLKPWGKVHVFNWFYLVTNLCVFLSPFECIFFALKCILVKMYLSLIKSAFCYPANFMWPSPRMTCNRRRMKVVWYDFDLFTTCHVATRPCPLHSISYIIANIILAKKIYMINTKSMFGNYFFFPYFLFLKIIFYFWD